MARVPHPEPSSTIVPSKPSGTSSIIAALTRRDVGMGVMPVRKV
ncbi:MAG: hypothetical protein QGI06_06825 [Rhodospirillales bacterium]|nr:hypothetical protein [Rhodospirillales bacterium]